MLNKIVFYTKMGIKLIKKDIINNKDYRKEYNKVSSTYHNWIAKMGRYTDYIIKPEYIRKKQKIKVLDFACGTGYITKKIIEKKINCEITAVDMSDKMLDKLRCLNDKKVKTINSDGIEFLKSTDEKYDIIYFGWALSYFNYKELFKLFKRVLNQDGIVCIITNTQGTLESIENIFLKVMYQNYKEVLRPMNIRFNLPNGKKGLTKWFKRYGFEKLEVDDAELVIRFDTPEQLLDWLNNTGAVAGTTYIFKDYNKIKNNLIKEIKLQKYNNKKYEINHKFTYGIYRLR